MYILGNITKHPIYCSTIFYAIKSDKTIFNSSIILADYLNLINSLSELYKYIFFGNITNSSYLLPDNIQQFLKTPVVLCPYSIHL